VVGDREDKEYHDTKTDKSAFNQDGQIRVVGNKAPAMDTP
jgi:hypothetical protein